jgi:hypothetical protein
MLGDKIAENRAPIPAPTPLLIRPPVRIPVGIPVVAPVESVDLSLCENPWSTKLEILLNDEMMILDGNSVSRKARLCIRQHGFIMKASKPQRETCVSD